MGKTAVAVALVLPPTVICVVFSPGELLETFTTLYVTPPKNYHTILRFQNIFPLAKVSFAKGNLLGAGRHPTGP